MHSDCSILTNEYFYENKFTTKSISFPDLKNYAFCLQIDFGSYMDGDFR